MMRATGSSRKINSPLLKVIIGTLSSLSFSVYVIHAHPIVLDYILYDTDFWYRSLCEEGILYCFARLVASVAAIYLICAFIDIIRQ